MQELFEKYLDNVASPAEVRQLLALFNFPENEAELRKLILQCLEYIDYDEDMNLCKSITEKKLESIKKQINASNGKILSLLKSFWFPATIANCLTLHITLQV